ncbi:MAG: c-type cytochrome biogenesis protein CcmI [Hahellaceae bacterium]|nr:c-type cytochrome biogenesis protein CcmI [Hahellaceae bacterium]MCP5212817.1 c-type cytochrome biogenesis protein CcmI [Hahellaceae bacterium]
MLDIWLGSTVLLVLAMVFILWPVFRNRKVALSDSQLPLTQQALNIAVYKDRLQELQKEKANGVISESKYEELLAELETGLLADADDKLESVETPQKVSLQRLPLAAALVMVLILPLASWGLYWKWGAYVSLEDSRTNESVVAATEGMPSTDIEQLLETLKQRLAESPDNLDGWFLLGRSYMNMERFEEAAAAFYKVTALLEKQGEDPSAVYGMVAQALYFADQGVSEEVSSVMNKALALNPNEINSLGLLGMQAFDDQRYVDAIRAWQKILDVAPAHPSRLAIEEGIGKARAHLNETGVAVPDEVLGSRPNPTAASGPRLTINVDISPELKKSAAPEDTLFVYARAMNGPKMPLAIVRKQVQDLPFTVVLDDSMAMGPMAKLSSFPEVEVLARVSKLGAPAPNPGDLEGRLGPIETESAVGELFVLIETVVR